MSNDPAAAFPKQWVPIRVIPVPVRVDDEVDVIATEISNGCLNSWNHRWKLIVHDEDASGRPLALRWTALDPEMINFRLLDMMRARTLDRLMEEIEMRGLS